MKILLLNVLPEKLPTGNAKQAVGYIGWRSNSNEWNEDRNLKIFSKCEVIKVTGE